jgi:hypothetical protein
MAPNDNPVVLGGATPLNDGLSEPGFDRYSAILDVDRFKKEYLFGIPLISPLTKQVVDDETLKNFIRKGIGDFETTVRVMVNPVRITDRFDFERADDLLFGTRRVTRWPVLKVENLKALWPGRMELYEGNTQEIDYPTSWVSLQGDTGLIRIIPNSGTLVNADTNFVTSSGYKAIVLGGMKAWPNMWRVTYIAGMDFDKVPDVVNDLIGIMAAIKFLSMMGPAIFPVASQAVGLDGMSQSVGTGGPQWLQSRILELQAERDRLSGVLKSHYCTEMNMVAW